MASSGEGEQGERPSEDLAVTLKGIAERAFTERFGESFEGVFDGPIVGADEGIVVADSFEDAIRSPANTVATVERDGEIAGFSLAVPIEAFDPERAAEAGSTAYAYVSAIDPEFQNQGLIAPLSMELAHQLHDDGYTHVETEVVHKDGYADNVAKAYEGAIERQEDQEGYPEVGPQTFFRINIDKAPIGRWR